MGGQRPASLLENGAALPAVPRELVPEEILASSPPADVTPEPEKSAKPASSAFPPELLESLAQRFETPDSWNRWDRPLFTVVGFEEPLPLAEIRSALFENRAPPAPSVYAVSGNFLHQLDQATNQVLRAMMEAQKGAVPGDVLTLPGTTEHLLFTGPLTIGKLSRLRCQFISYTKMHPNNENLPQLSNVFLKYLNQNLP